MIGMGFGFGWLGLIVMVLFWGGLIVLAIWLARTIFGSNHQSSAANGREPSAKDILDQRYARGEITREQYQQMLLDLKN